MPGNWRHKTDLFNLEAMAKYGRHLPNMEGFSFVCFYGGKSSRWLLCSPIPFYWTLFTNRQMQI